MNDARNDAKKHRAAPGVVALVCGAAIVAAGACAADDEPPPRCIDLPSDVGDACAPAYEPTYANVFSRTLQPSCGKPGVSCHANEGRQGGISFADESSAYDAIVGKSVRAGDPACSDLVARITSTDGMVRMPPGASLPLGERCAIVRWIAEGAKR